MHEDKFGKNDDRSATVYISCFLRRCGRNTAIGARDMNSNILKNVADPLSNQYVATKNYVDNNGITTFGGAVIW